MTNIADCLQRAIDFGEIDRSRGQALLGDFDQLVARYRSTMSQSAAIAQAGKDLKEANKAKTARRRHIVLNQLRAMKKIERQILSAPDPALAIRNLLEFSEGSGFRGESVRSLTEAYEQSINAGMAGVLEKTGLNVLGNSRDGRMLEDMIRELHGEATGNAGAKALAEAVQAQQQRMRRAFNSYGGDIGNLSDYGVPHAHDAGQLMQRGFDAWAAAILPRLAWDRITDFRTGKPFAAAGATPDMGDVRAFLQDVYDGITTRGWDDRNPSLSVGGRALANQRAEHRVLHFKSGSAWIEYNREFGTADPFSAMMNGLHGMARDVALLRVLGPNPRAGLTFAEQVGLKRAADLGNRTLVELGMRSKKEALIFGNPTISEHVRGQSAVSKAMLAHQDGSANMPEHVGWARFFGGTRAVLTSIQLGSAVITSVTDVATMTAAAQTVGMSATDVLSRSVKLMKAANRAEAARMGYVAETLADTGAGMSRFFGQTFGGGIPDRLASFTLRATGLSFLTDMRKMAFQMEFAGYMAENAALAFADLPQGLREVFQTRSITPEDWDALRDPTTRFTARDGADFISPFHWLETQTKMPRVEAEGLAMRLQAAIREQLELAIPTASVEGRARLQGTAAPGTVAGELSRSFMSYKSFALSMMLGQYRRFANADSWGMNRWGYAAKVSAMLVLLGGVAIQLKELAKGNDPRPMNEAKFWMAAMFQGGGLGIFGDFFNAETSRVGGGLAETIAGPVVGAAGDLIKPVASNITAAVKGGNTFVGRDVANTVRRNTPFLSSAWYARTAYSRLVADNLQAFLDPEAELLFRRRLKRQAADYGTQPFVPVRGTGTEFRLPNFANAITGGSQ